jgi:PBS lyase HEAT-like repeat
VVYGVEIGDLQTSGMLRTDVVDDEEGVVTEEERVSALVHILLSAAARLDERDDAATDLGQCRSPQAIEALLAVARDPEVDVILAASCGESLAEVAVRNLLFRQDLA